MSKTILTIASIIIFALSGALLSQENSDNGVVPTIKEVFLKGSIDGKKLFMVVGVSNAKELIAKKIIKKTVDLERLQKLGDNFIFSMQEVGMLVNNNLEGPTQIAPMDYADMHDYSWAFVKGIPEQL